MRCSLPACGRARSPPSPFQFGKGRGRLPGGSRAACGGRPPLLALRSARRARRDRRRERARLRHRGHAVPVGVEGAARRRAETIAPPAQGPSPTTASELGRVACPVRRPTAVGDVHLLLDKLALVQREPSCRRRARRSGRSSSRRCSRVAEAHDQRRERRLRRRRGSRAARDRAARLLAPPARHPQLREADERRRARYAARMSSRCSSGRCRSASAGRPRTTSSSRRWPRRSRRSRWS